MKKVAFVASIYTHLKAFHIPYMKLLRDKGYEVHAYAGPDQAKECILTNGFVCHDIPFERNPIKLKNVATLRMLLASFKEEKFDLIHLHTPVASVIGRIAAKIAKVPSVVYTAHGFHFFTGAPLFNWLVYYPIEYVVSRWTDYLITINQEDYLRASKYFSVRKEVIYVPGVGADLTIFPQNSDEVRKEKRKGLGINGREIVIIYIAEFTDNKNQMYLVEAIDQLVNKQKIDIKCLLVGAGEQLKSVANQINNRNLHEYIRILGYRNDISELLVAADIAALFSKREGLPKALMEALAAGKPILATDVRGNRDIVVDGENGFIVPLNDTEKTKEAILQLYNDHELRTRMGLKSKCLSKKYDLELIVNEMDKIYTKALNYK